MELHEIQQSLAEGSLAILHLDFMAGLFDMANQSDQGSQFVANCTNWHSAVSGHSPQVLSIFTTLAFSHETRPELGNGTPFHKLLQSFGSESFSKHSPATQIAPQFTLTNNDVVLAKTGWYAGTGNALEQILAAQRIRTVIISGITITGVVMATVYRLFDLGYTVYVISDNILELPVEQTDGMKQFMVNDLLPKMHVNVISLDDALHALGDRE